MATYINQTGDLSNIAKEADIFDYNYTGAEVSIILPAGEYTMECWGARGGSPSSTVIGVGGWSYGHLIISNKTQYYLSCGGAGATNNSGGWNGGGASNGSKYGSGGGATHIATQSGLLSTRSSDYTSTVLMVAGGAGGSGTLGVIGGTLSGGKGGGTTGSNGNYVSGSTYGTGGSQSAAGGCNGTSAGQGAFGIGGNYYSEGSGGGGGLYGGGGSQIVYSLMGNGGTGGGGSGYFNPTFITNGGTTTESTSTNPDTTNYAGYIRISVVSITPTINVPVKVNGTWYSGKHVYGKIDGVWKEASDIFVKINGNWKGGH